MGEKGTSEFGTTKLFKGKRGVRQRIAKRNGISDAFSCDIAFSETPEIVVSFTLKAIKVGTEVQDFLRGNVCAALVSLSKTPCGEKQTKQQKKLLVNDSKNQPRYLQAPANTTLVLKLTLAGNFSVDCHVAYLFSSESLAETIGFHGSLQHPSLRCDYQHIKTFSYV